MRGTTATRSGQRGNHQAPILKREDWAISTFWLAPPEQMEMEPLAHLAQAILVEQRSDVSWRGVWKRIRLQESEDFRRAFQQFFLKPQKPLILSARSKCGKPHLPIEARLMRSHPPRGAIDRTGLPLEFVRLPSLTIVTSVNQDLRSGGGHDGEQAVGVDASKGLKNGKEALDRCWQLAAPKSHFRCSPGRSRRPGSDEPT